MPSLRQRLMRLRMALSRSVFELLERRGVHLTRKQFHSPIPDLAELRAAPDLFTRKSALPGIDMNPRGQRRMLDEVVAPRLRERDFPRTKEEAGSDHDYYARQGTFGLLSATFLHSIIRHHRPKRIIEAGSGWSTMVSA